MIARPGKALFLDRDGVINVNYGYVYEKEKFDFIEGIFDLCRIAQHKGYQIFIVTNQSGIARSYYSQSDFDELMRWVKKSFSLKGVGIKQIYHCPHHPKQNNKFGIICTCRKPKPGMVIKARNQFRLNLAESIFVGDSLSDMQCAINAKVRKRVLLQHSKPKITGLKLEAPNKTPYYRAYKLSAIAKLL